MGKRLLILQTHPIQYFAPLYRLLSERGTIDITVLYMTDAGAVRHFDPGFGKAVAWDVDLMSGYRSIVACPGGSITDKGFFGRRISHLAEILEGERPDWVYVYGYNALANWQMMARCRMAGIRLLYSADSNARLGRTALLSLSKQLPVRLFFSQIDHFLFSGEANRDYLRQFGADDNRMTWSPFAIDVDFFGRLARRQRTPRPFDFAWIGKLLVRKRASDFIDALRRIKNRGLSFRAVIGGDGPEFDAIRLRASELISDGSLEFRGFMSQAQVADALANSESFVFTSEYDAYGLAVTEAAAAGCAIVATGCSGCVGQLGSAREGVNALIYEAGDVDGLSRKITDLLTNDKLRCALQEGSRAIAPEHALDVAAAQIEAVVLNG